MRRSKYSLFAERLQAREQRRTSPKHRRFSLHRRINANLHTDTHATTLHAQHVPQQQCHLLRPVLLKIWAKIYRRAPSQSDHNGIRQHRVREPPHQVIIVVYDNNRPPRAVFWMYTLTGQRELSTCIFADIIWHRESIHVISEKIRPTLLVPELDKGLADSHMPLRQCCVSLLAQMLAQRPHEELHVHVAAIVDLTVRALNDPGVGVRNKVCDNLSACALAARNTYAFKSMCVSGYYLCNMHAFLQPAPVNVSYFLFWGILLRSNAGLSHAGQGVLCSHRRHFPKRGTEHASAREYFVASLKILSLSLPCSLFHSLSPSLPPSLLPPLPPSLYPSTRDTMSSQLVWDMTHSYVGDDSGLWSHAQPALQTTQR